MMLRVIADVYKRSKLIIRYALFGVVTTLANFFAFVICTNIFTDEFYVFNNAVAWFVGVVAAFVTNKLWVFESKGWRIKVAGKEFAEFTVARLLSFAFEELGLIICVSGFGLGRSMFTLCGHQLSTQIIIKLVLSVGVVISNYFVSKYLIFKKSNSD